MNQIRNQSQESILQFNPALCTSTPNISHLKINTAQSGNFDTISKSQTFNRLDRNFNGTFNGPPDRYCSNQQLPYATDKFSE